MGMHVFTTEWGEVRRLQAQGTLRGSSRCGPKAGSLSPDVIWTCHHPVIQQRLVRGLPWAHPSDLVPNLMEHVSPGERR